MEQSLDVEPGAVREGLSAAIAQYEEMIARLKGDSPEFPAHAVGAGFVEYGRSLSDAIGQMQELSVKFLETRVAGWRELIVLVDSVEAVDFANAGEVG